MPEPYRPVKEQVSLTDVDDEMPSPGSKVYALSLGGALCEVVWRADSHKHYMAWMEYPKIPKAVKEKMHNLYMNGGWKSGHEFQCDSGVETQRR